MKTVIGIEEIKTIIPHSYPFLLIDRVVDLKDKYCKGIKNVTINEPYFQGHFPKFSIMPGVLQIEAMAQLGAIYKFKTCPEISENLIYFLTIDKAKFRGMVVPGDVLNIEINVIRETQTRLSLFGKASVDGKVVSEANLIAVAHPPKKD